MGHEFRLDVNGFRAINRQQQTIDGNTGLGNHRRMWAMELPGGKVVSADPPSETVRESRGDLNQRELVLKSHRCVSFGGDKRSVCTCRVTDGVL